MTNQKHIDCIVSEVMAMEAEQALEAGKLGFMCRALAIATMPHKKPTSGFYVRKNGNFTLRYVKGNFDTAPNVLFDNGMHVGFHVNF